MSDEFEWDEDNLCHIAEHDVSPEEAEHVLLHGPVELEYQDWQAKRSGFKRSALHHQAAFSSF
jgi:hypothetical protein